jgi:hypothetical protein
MNKIAILAARVLRNINPTCEIKGDSKIYAKNKALAPNKTF